MNFPIVCNLPEPEQARRKQEIATEILEGVQETRELPDGYAFRFPGASEWAAKITSFISVERKCCPFLTFELVFDPELGPIWLRLRGPEGVKVFLEQAYNTAQLRSKLV